jgi:hypothetical protein
MRMDCTQKFWMLTLYLLVLDDAGNIFVMFKIDGPFYFYASLLTHGYYSVKYIFFILLKLKVAIKLLAYALLIICQKLG